MCVVRNRGTIFTNIIKLFYYLFMFQLLPVTLHLFPKPLWSHYICVCFSWKYRNDVISLSDCNFIHSLIPPIAHEYEKEFDDCQYESVEGEDVAPPLLHEATPSGQIQAESAGI